MVENQKVKVKNEVEAEVDINSNISFKTKESNEFNNVNLSISDENVLMKCRILKIDKQRWIKDLNFSDKESIIPEYIKDYKTKIDQIVDELFKKDKEHQENNSLNEMEDPPITKCRINFLKATFLVINFEKEKSIVNDFKIESQHHNQNYSNKDTDFKTSQLVNFIIYQSKAIIKERNVVEILRNYIFSLYQNEDKKIETLDKLNQTKLTKFINDLLISFVEKISEDINKNKKVKPYIRDIISTYNNAYFDLYDSIDKYNGINCNNCKDLLIEGDDNLFSKMIHTEAYLFIQLYMDYLENLEKFQNFFEKIIGKSNHKNETIRIVLLIQSKLKCCKSCKNFLYQLREVYRERIFEYNTKNKCNFNDELDLIFQYQDDKADQLRSSNNTCKNSIESKNNEINLKLQKLTNFLEYSKVTNQFSKEFFFQYQNTQIKFFEKFTFVSGYNKNKDNGKTNEIDNA